MITRVCAAVVAAVWCVAGIAAPASAQYSEQRRLETNAGTVGIVSGGIAGTYIRIASDLAAVLDQGDEMRILPIVGRGSIQNIDDILYLRGVDVGIVQSDVLTYIQRQEGMAGIEDYISYITKLYNEELHIVAREDIESIEDLEGEQVNFGTPAAGTYMTSSLIFDTLGINVEPTEYDYQLGLEMVKNGELAAMVYIAGKPTDLFVGLEPGDGVKFLEVPYDPRLLETYLPSTLDHTDYPRLLAEGKSVPTLAVGAVMAVYNWPERSWRALKVARFVDAFFGNFEKFQQAPRHPKWQEVNLAAELPGWTRFHAAEQWLQENAGAPGVGDQAATSQPRAQPARAAQ